MPCLFQLHVLLPPPLPTLSPTTRHSPKMLHSLRSPYPGTHCAFWLKNALSSSVIPVCQADCYSSSRTWLTSSLINLDRLAVIFPLSIAPCVLELVSHCFMMVLFHVCGLLICGTLEGSNFVFSTWRLSPSSVPGLPIPDHYIP